MPKVTNSLIFPLWLKRTWHKVVHPANPISQIITRAHIQSLIIAIAIATATSPSVVIVGRRRDAESRKLRIQQGLVKTITCLWRLKLFIRRTQRTWTPKRHRSA
ncbi:hypothetical protein ACB098_01G017200 [Castanea mollissima]